MVANPGVLCCVAKKQVLNSGNKLLNLQGPHTSCYPVTSAAMCDALATGKSRPLIQAMPTAQYQPLDLFVRNVSRAMDSTTDDVALNLNAADMKVAWASALWPWVLLPVIYRLLIIVMVPLAFQPLYKSCMRRSKKFKAFVNAFIGTRDRHPDHPYPLIWLGVGQLLFSLVSILMFAVTASTPKTYIDESNRVERKAGSVLGAYFIFHQLVLLLKEEFVVEDSIMTPSTLVDVLTVPQLLIGARCHSLSLSFLRVYRALETYERLEFLNKMGIIEYWSSASDITRESVLIGLRFLAVIVIFAGIILILEILGELPYLPDDLFHSAMGDISIFTLCYWVIETVATVGYGDFAPKTILSRCVTMACFLAGVAFFTYEAEVFTELMNREHLGKGRHEETSREDVVILGTAVEQQDEYILSFFFAELFHETYKRKWPNVVVLVGTELEVTRMMHLLDRIVSFQARGSVFVLKGSAFDTFDLERCGCHRASMIYIIASTQRQQGQAWKAEDSPGTSNDDLFDILKAVFVQRSFKRIPLELVLRRSESIDLAVGMGIAAQRCIAIDEIKSTLMWQSCRCMGWNAFVSNLVLSASTFPASRPDDIDTAPGASDWRSQYEEGLRNGIYGFLPNARLVGRSFLDAVEEAADHNGVLVFAAQLYGDVVLAPFQVLKHIQSHMVIFALAKSQRDLKGIADDTRDWRRVFNRNRLRKHTQASLRYSLQLLQKCLRSCGVDRDGLVKKNQNDCGSVHGFINDAGPGGHGDNALLSALELENEILRGECYLEQDSNNHGVTRIVHLVELHVQRKDKFVLVELGNWHDHDGAKPLCILPRKRRVRKESTHSTFQKLLFDEVSCILDLDSLEFLETSVEDEFKTDVRMGLTTKYVRTINFARIAASSRVPCSQGQERELIYLGQPAGAPASHPLLKYDLFARQCGSTIKFYTWLPLGDVSLSFNSGDVSDMIGRMVAVFKKRFQANLSSTLPRQMGASCWELKERHADAIRKNSERKGGVVVFIELSLNWNRVAAFIRESRKHWYPARTPIIVLCKVVASDELVLDLRLAGDPLIGCIIGPVADLTNLRRSGVEEAAYIVCPCVESSIDDLEESEEHLEAEECAMNDAEAILVYKMLNAIGVTSRCRKLFEFGRVQTDQLLPQDSWKTTSLKPAFHRTMSVPIFGKEEKASMPTIIEKLHRWWKALFARGAEPNTVQSALNESERYITGQLFTLGCLGSMLAQVHYVPGTMDIFKELVTPGVSVDMFVWQVKPPPYLVDKTFATCKNELLRGSNGPALALGLYRKFPGADPRDRCSGYVYACPHPDTLICSTDLVYVLGSQAWGCGFGRGSGEEWELSDVSGFSRQTSGESGWDRDPFPRHLREAADRASIIGGARLTEILLEKITPRKEASIPSNDGSSDASSSVQAEPEVVESSVSEISGSLDAVNVINPNRTLPDSTRHGQQGSIVGGPSSAEVCTEDAGDQVRAEPIMMEESLPKINIITPTSPLSASTKHGPLGSTQEVIGESFRSPSPSRTHPLRGNSRSPGAARTPSSPEGLLPRIAELEMLVFGELRSGILVNRLHALEVRLGVQASERAGARMRLSMLEGCVRGESEAYDALNSTTKRAFPHQSTDSP